MTIKKTCSEAQFFRASLFLLFFFRTILLRTMLLFALPFYPMANSTERPFRHPLSRVPPSGSIANATRLRGPFQSGVGSFYSYVAQQKVKVVRPKQIRLLIRTIKWQLLKGYISSLETDLSLPGLT